MPFRALIGGYSMDTLVQDLKYVLRTLGRHPGFTVAVLPGNRLGLRRGSGHGEMAEKFWPGQDPIGKRVTMEWEQSVGHGGTLAGSRLSGERGGKEDGQESDCEQEISLGGHAEEFSAIKDERLGGNTLPPISPAGRPRRRPSPTTDNPDLARSDTPRRHRAPVPFPRPPTLRREGPGTPRG